MALADKLDTLVGFWAIDEKPTGSKDPYALRRAALGIVRIIIQSNLRLPLKALIHRAGFLIMADIGKERIEFIISKMKDLNVLIGAEPENLVIDMNSFKARPIGTTIEELSSFLTNLSADLLAFFADRLKVYLKDQGARHDLIDAVFSLGGQDDLLMIVRRVEALSKFLDSDDGKNLLAGVKRASNILKIEEKKDNRSFNGLPNPQLLIQGEERDLHRAVSAAEANARKAVEHEDFGAAMSAIAKLRGPVDAFFDKVTVNADDPSFRENRLKLLNEIRDATRAVADFSKIQD